MNPPASSASSASASASARSTWPRAPASSRPRWGSSDAAAAAVRSGPNIYSLPEGVAELRHAIADKLTRDNAIAADPDAEVTITAGATGAYFAALSALVSPGDEVILFEPVYSWHRDAARMAGVTPRLVPPRATGVPPRSGPAARRDRPAHARAIVVCTPGNPSGRVLGEDELAGIAAVAREHDLLVLSDEVYEYLVYDGRRHVSPASLAQLADRTVSIMSLSKTFNVTGWRLGYVVARPELTRALRVAHDLMVTCAPTPLQHAAVAALRMPPSYHDGLRRSFQDKRDRLVDALHAAGLEPQSPQGACHVLASYGTAPRRPPRRRSSSCGGRSWPRSPAPRSASPGAIGSCASACARRRRARRGVPPAAPPLTAPLLTKHRPTLEIQPLDRKRTIMLPHLVLFGFAAVAINKYLKQQREPPPAGR